MSFCGDQVRTKIIPIRGLHDPDRSPPFGDLVSGAGAFRLARKAIRVSQTRVARHAGVSRSAISGIERDKRQPKADELMRLASLLRFRPEQLMGAQYPAYLDGRAPPACYRAEAKQPKELHPHDARELSECFEDLKRWGGSWEWQAMDARTSERKLRQQLENRFEWGPDAPYDVFRSMYSAGIMLRFTALESIAGAVVRHGKAIGVLINSDQPDDRQRWSAAHELAHVLLEHEAQDTAHVDLHGPARTSDDRLADWLAGNLLMPASEVDAELVNVEREHPDETMEQAVYRLSRKFSVSYAAMAVRLGALQIVSFEGVQQLRKTKPKELKKQLGLPDGGRSFEPASSLPTMVRNMEALGVLPSDWTDDFDMVTGPGHVRLLQQAAVRDYIENVDLRDRADSVTRVFERVAMWVAETYPILP